MLRADGKTALIVAINKSTLLGTREENFEKSVKKESSSDDSSSSDSDSSEDSDDWPTWLQIMFAYFLTL